MKLKLFLSLMDVAFFTNAADSGGGMYNDSSNPTLTNVIIANSAGGDCVNSGSAVVAANHNLIQDTGINACGLTDDVNGNVTGQNPLLGPLTDFGGPGRQAHPLLPGSPAIDAGAGAPDCPAADQRGVPRPYGAACDIGAYEAAPRLLYLPLVVKP